MEDHVILEVRKFEGQGHSLQEVVVKTRNNLKHL